MFVSWKAYFKKIGVIVKIIFSITWKKSCNHACSLICYFYKPRPNIGEAYLEKENVLSNSMYFKKNLRKNCTKEYRLVTIQNSGKLMTNIERTPWGPACQNTKSASSGQNTKSATSGQNAKTATSGQNTKSDTSGPNTKSATSGQNTKSATSGQNTISAT